MGDARERSLLARWQQHDDRDALEEVLRIEVAGLKQRVREAQGGSTSTSASDVAQEAVARLLQASPAPRFETPAGLRGYLWRAARNLLVDRLRRARHVPLELGPTTTQSLLAEPSTSGELGGVEHADLNDALELALNLLRPADQEILRLVYFDGLSIEDAGNRLGVERDSANTRLVRARVRLAEKLATWREFVAE